MLAVGLQGLLHLSFTGFIWPLLVHRSCQNRQMSAHYSCFRLAQQERQSTDFPECQMFPLTCHNIGSFEMHCDIYPRTKHGTISPFSILLSHDEHTPWWIGPSPSERDDNQTSTLPVSLPSTSHSLWADTHNGKRVARTHFPRLGRFFSPSLWGGVAVIQPLPIQSQ